jgi:hypothetical protein
MTAESVSAANKLIQETLLSDCKKGARHLLKAFSGNDTIGSPVRPSQVDSITPKEAGLPQREDQE